MDVINKEFGFGKIHNAFEALFHQYDDITQLVHEMEDNLEWLEWQNKTDYLGLNPSVDDSTIH